MRRETIGIITAVVLGFGLAGAARGQPAEPAPPDPDADADDDDAATPAGAVAPVEPATPESPYQPAPPPVVEPPEPVVQPELFRAPTGRLLPAGHIYSRSGVDTGGGLSSGLRVGLGDVAEFGVDLTDQVRQRTGDDGEPGRIFPYGTASFKMGIGENSLFRAQPALALGFRKSFERESDGHTTRFAELYLVASKALGSRADLHVGASVWDAVITTNDRSVYLHDKDFAKQVRAFGGLELVPLPDSSILLEVSWTPEFVYGVSGAPDKIKLTPMFTWGVRYAVADWIALESGVRIPDIRDADLLGAQIFGQVKFVSRALKRAIARAK